MRDQFLTEKVLGECWHIAKLNSDMTFSHGECNKCGFKQPEYYSWTITHYNINFSTPEGFFKLWNFCKEQEWFDKFAESYPHKAWLIPIAYIEPDTFADAIYKYYKQRKEVKTVETL